VQRRTKLEDREERELAEEIRLSLAETRPQSSPTESKGAAAAGCPGGECCVLNAAFTSLTNEFVFLPQLDFSSSRTASPTRDAASLTFTAGNFVRCARVGALLLPGAEPAVCADAAGSFGDDGCVSGGRRW
jgi:hypothetical protein